MPPWMIAVGEWVNAHPRFLAAVDLLHAICWPAFFATCLLFGWRSGYAVRELFERGKD